MNNAGKANENSVESVDRDGDIVYSGNCLCEGIAFKVQGRLADIQICHCTECRKAQGTPFASNIPVRQSEFELLRGKSLIKEHPSNTVTGKYRAFCRNCGSPVYSRVDSKPDVLRLRAGLLQGILHTKIASHAFTAEKANWWEIHDKLPQHSGKRK